MTSVDAACARAVCCPCVWCGEPGHVMAGGWRCCVGHGPGAGSVARMSGSPWRLVREFHRVFGLARAERPTSIPTDLAEVRRRLLAEEVAELAEAMRGGHLHEIAHELADVVYVTYGTAVTYGIDLDAVLAEVHKANMSKLDAEGRPVIKAGKVQKSERYQPPDVAEVLRQQSAATSA